MAQAGIHSVIGMAVQKWIPGRTWLMLGIVLGNLLPDADNLAVAVATVAGFSTTGLHRTFTHSLFFAAVVIIGFYLIAKFANQARWKNLGIGLGIGILMHILVDLLIWFNGVEILWPLSSWVNLWGNFSPADWWEKLMMPVENLAFAGFFLLLERAARKHGTNSGYLKKLRLWMWGQVGLFLLFLVLVYALDSGFMVIFGAVYLLSLGLVIGVTIRMRETIEAGSQNVSASQLA